MSKLTTSDMRPEISTRRKSPAEKTDELYQVQESLRSINAYQSLTLDRTDIRFTDIGNDRVSIEITIRNVGDARTPPTRVVIQAAPLGAFVAWQPLVELELPAMAPGESHTLTTQAVRPRPDASGGFSIAPPGAKPVALGQDDERDLRGRDRENTGTPTLPPDLLELCGHRNTNWAGNINVFIGKLSVERHLSRALRIYPGRTNVALFFVGEQPDSYQFSIEGADESWHVKLFASESDSPLELELDNARLIRQTGWIETTGRRTIFLTLLPPENCTTGSVDVHVRQWSSARQAIVEFGFDPSAAGPGCFTV